VRGGRCRCACSPRIRARRTLVVCAAIMAIGLMHQMARMPWLGPATSVHVPPDGWLSRYGSVVDHPGVRLAA
jgi:hypothetical protein